MMLIKIYVMDIRVIDTRVMMHVRLDLPLGLGGMTPPLGTHVYVDKTHMIIA